MAWDAGGSGVGSATESSRGFGSAHESGGSDNDRGGGFASAVESFASAVSSFASSFGGGGSDNDRRGGWGGGSDGGSDDSGMSDVAVAEAGIESLSWGDVVDTNDSEDTRQASSLSFGTDFAASTDDSEDARQTSSLSFGTGFEASTDDSEDTRHSSSLSFGPDFAGSTDDAEDTRQAGSLSFGADFVASADDSEDSHQANSLSFGAEIAASPAALEDGRSVEETGSRFPGAMTVEASGVGSVLSSDDFAPAFQDGIFGPTSVATEQGMALRAARTVSGGFTDTVTVHSLTDGSAVVEYAQTGNIALGRGVETNLSEMGSQMPGQQPGQLSSAQAEVIANFGPRVDIARELAFPSVSEAESFASDVRERGFQEAYADYAAAQGFPADAPLAGYSVGVGFDASAKAYGSMTPQGLPGLERSWGAMVPGAYGHGIAGLSLGANYTADNPEGAVRMDKFDQFMDVGAPGAWSLHGGISGEAFSALSLGTAAELSFGEENLALTGTLTTDVYGTFFGDVTTYSHISSGLIPTDGPFSDVFRDGRLRALGAPGPGIVAFGLQAAEDIQIGSTGYRTEIRGILGYDDADIVDALVGAEESSLDHTPPQDRIAAIQAADPSLGAVFTSDWEQTARAELDAIRDMETRASGYPDYEPMTDEEWSEALHEAFLTEDAKISALENGVPEWEWARHTEGIVGEMAAGYQWRDTHITRERVEAYAAWDEIAAERLAAREAELQAMTPPEIYEAYRDLGQRQPGVYLSVQQSEEERSFGTMQVSVAGIPNASQYGPNGLYGARGFDITRSSAVVGQIGVTPQAFDHFSSVIDDPVAGPALAALVNTAAYPRYSATVDPATGETVFNAAGTLVSPSPPAQLMYDGFTPTDVIRGLTTGVGYERDLSHLPGVYSVGAEDASFTDIAERGLAQLQAAGVIDATAVFSEEHIDQYAAAIVDTNFPGLPAARVEELMFSGANIASAVAIPLHGSGFRRGICRRVAAGRPAGL